MRAMLGNAAQAMAADIGQAIATGQLSAAEVGQLQGVLAGQDAARQNLMGASAWESAAHSTVIGGVTTFTSAVMLKGFGNVIGGTTLSLPATFGQKVMTYSLNAIASFGLGASTAAVGTAAGNLADMLLKGEHSTYAQLVAQYKGKGMAEDNAKAAAAVELFAKQPIIAGLENGAIAAAMSLPATAAALRAAETMGGRAMVADEQGAFKRLHALEAETKIVDTANKAVDVYTELIALPKEVLPDANLKALQTAYRNFEANATAENASALLKEVDASVRVAAQKMGSGITANAGYRRYLNMLDEVAAANKAGMTAREFAASKGVSSTLTDAEAAAADTAGLKMEMDGDGTGGYNRGEYSAEGAESIGKRAQTLGVIREQKVAESTGGTVSREPIKSIAGSTDIDVIAPNGDLIMVGGPAKAKNLGALGQVIKIYQDEAAIRGVNVIAYFSTGTPRDVIDFAIKRLGKENVFIFE